MTPTPKLIISLDVILAELAKMRGEIDLAKDLAADRQLKHEVLTMYESADRLMTRLEPRN